MARDNPKYPQEACSNEKWYHEWFLMIMQDFRWPNCGGFSSEMRCKRKSYFVCNNLSVKSYQHGYHFSAKSIIHDPRVAPSPSSATKFGCSNFKQFIYYQFMTRTRRVGGAVVRLYCVIPLDCCFSVTTTTASRCLCPLYTTPLFFVVMFM